MISANQVQHSAWSRSLPTAGGHTKRYGELPVRTQHSPYFKPQHQPAGDSTQTSYLNEYTREGGSPQHDLSKPGAAQRMVQRKPTAGGHTKRYGELPVRTQHSPCFNPQHQPASWLVLWVETGAVLCPDRQLSISLRMPACGRLPLDHALCCTWFAEIMLRASPLSCVLVQIASLSAVPSWLVLWFEIGAVLCPDWQLSISLRMPACGR